MANRGGVGFLGVLASLLTVLFVGLKLGEIGVVADWSWWAVLSPILIYIGLGVLAFIIILIASIFD